MLPYQAISCCTRHVTAENTRTGRVSYVQLSLTHSFPAIRHVVVESATQHPAVRNRQPSRSRKGSPLKES